MPSYVTTWKDYRLPTGQEFAMAVCGYNGKVRHMTIGNDPLRRMFVREVTVEGDFCSTAQHCLALDCPLNKTEQEHLSHMLDMRQDEPVDAETAKLWGRDTAVGCLVEMARRFSKSLESEQAQAPAQCEPPA
jgi:hypothetical protein